VKDLGPVRTALFVPGNQPDRIDKALKTEADVIIIDLEDAVPVAQKEKTRTVVRKKLIENSQRSILVRVNGIASGFLYGDLDVVLVGSLAGLILPKVETPANIREINGMLLMVEKTRGIEIGTIPVIPLIESAKAVQNIFEIVSEKTFPPRLYTVAFGAADYALNMGIDLTKPGLELLHPKSAIPIACRAAEIEPPLDSPFMIDLKDMRAIEADARRAKSLGFQGKLCIHPNQVERCNAIFSPSTAEINYAKKVVKAFEEAEAEGIAAIQLEGQFVDYAVVERSRRILRFAARFGKKK
jgi:citrate lyase subunit beta/citryl-CoA lyase